MTKQIHPQYAWLCRLQRIVDETALLPDVLDRWGDPIPPWRDLLTLDEVREEARGFLRGASCKMARFAGLVGHMGRAAKKQSRIPPAQDEVIAEILGEADNADV